MLVRIVLRVIIFNIAYRRCYASFHSRRRVRHSTRLQSPICPPSPPSSSVCRCWPSGHITQYTFQNWKWRLRCLYWKHCVRAQRAWLVPSSVRPGGSARRLCRINAGRKESASASAFKKEICRAVTWVSCASHSINLYCEVHSFHY